MRTFAPWGKIPRRIDSPFFPAPCATGHCPGDCASRAKPNLDALGCSAGDVGAADAPVCLRSTALGSKSRLELNASVNNASGKESPAAPSPAGLAASEPASPSLCEAVFGDGPRTPEDAPATLRGCGNAKPFFVFGAAVVEFEFDAPTLGFDALACDATDGPPNTPRDWFACPHPPAADAIGRTGHTPPVRGAGTRGAGIDATFGAADAVAALAEAVSGLPAPAPGFDSDAVWLSAVCAVLSLSVPGAVRPQPRDRWTAAETALPTLPPDDIAAVVRWCALDGAHPMGWPDAGGGFAREASLPLRIAALAAGVDLGGGFKAPPAF